MLNTPIETKPFLDFGESAWRPDYGSQAERIAVHLCDTAELGASIQRRMVAALANDVRVLAVIPEGIVALAPSAQVFLLRQRVELVTPSVEADRWELVENCTRQVVDEGVLLDPEMAAPLLIEKFAVALQDETSQKGSLLESALSLACSQVAGWRVRDVNLKTSNEELDVVIANNSAKAPWNGTAFILVEAKNWTRNVDRVEYDALHMKVSERGGSCRLGLFVAATGFSSGFYERASHHGAGHFSIVPVTVEWIIARLEARLTIEQALADRVESVVLDRRWEEG